MGPVGTGVGLSELQEPLLLCPFLLLSRGSDGVSLLLGSERGFGGPEGLGDLAPHLERGTSFWCPDDFLWGFYRRHTVFC